MFATKVLVYGFFLAIFLVAECRISEDHIHVNKELSTPATPVKEKEVSSPIPEPPGHSAACFHSTRELCPKPPQNCVRIKPHALLCCDVDCNKVKEGLSPELNSGNQEIQALHVLNATLDELNVSQSTWRRLRSIAFTDGNIREIVGDFNKLSPAYCFNVSNNGIQNITTRALVQLYNLTVLDISENKLTKMPHFSNGRDKEFSINIQGNNEMLCKSVLDALNRGYFKFINSETSYCKSSKTFRWFNTTELMPIKQMELMYSLQHHCGELDLENANCSCEIIWMDFVAGKFPMSSIAVDCSKRNLTKLPSKLPLNTIELNISYNEIETLAPFSDHPSYENVRQLFADHNKIQSLIELEGTKFIDNFAHLSLRANKIKSLPTYILSDTFDRNWREVHVFLGKNYLHCDCTTAKVLKLWLLGKTEIIPDYDQVMCENFDVKVIDLAESVVCQHQKDWTDYINYIIAVEIVMLFGLIAKVSYDYWVFKSAGYLPWPASKMPKLPCDWLCE